MKNERSKLTLDRVVTYQIKVPGRLDPHWEEWAGEIIVTILGDETSQPITILTGTFDQAALLGLLRRLYSLGLPLISVICLEV